MKKALTFTVLMPIFSLMVSANKIMDSIVGKGTLAMINDISGFLMIAGPIVCALCAVYFWIRRSGASEHDAIGWNKRIITAVICGVGLGLTSGLIALLTSYYQG